MNSTIRQSNLKAAGADDYVFSVHAIKVTLHLTAMLIASEGRRSKLIHSAPFPTYTKYKINQTSPLVNVKYVLFIPFHFVSFFFNSFSFWVGGGGGGRMQGQ